MDSVRVGLLQKEAEGTQTQALSQVRVSTAPCCSTLKISHANENFIRLGLAPLPVKIMVQILITNEQTSIINVISMLAKFQIHLTWDNNK